MTLTLIEKSLVLAAYFRGRGPDANCWTSNSDQVLTLSLFYTSDISEEDCVSRFAIRSCIQNLYAGFTEEHPWGILTDEIDARYKVLVKLLREHPELIEGGGSFNPPAHPTYTACGLTDLGLKLAATLVSQFPRKPDFPNWPDNRTMPVAE